MNLPNGFLTPGPCRLPPFFCPFCTGEAAEERRRRRGGGGFCCGSSCRKFRPPYTRADSEIAAPACILALMWKKKGKKKKEKGKKSGKKREEGKNGWSTIKLRGGARLEITQGGIKKIIINNLNKSGSDSCFIEITASDKGSCLCWMTYRNGLCNTLKFHFSNVSTVAHFNGEKRKHKPWLMFFFFFLIRSLNPHKHLTAHSLSQSTSVHCCSLFHLQLFFKVTRPGKGFGRPTNFDFKTSLSELAISFFFSFKIVFVSRMKFSN